MTKKNIIYLHTSNTSRVEGVHIFGIVDALNKSKGYKVHLIPSAKKKNTNKGSNRPSTISKYRERIPGSLFDTLLIIFNFIRFFKIRNSLKKIRPDLVYERYTPFQFIGCLIAKLYKVPYFLELNSTVDLDETRIYPISLKRISRYIEKKVFKNTDCFFPVSTKFINELRKEGINQRNIIVSPNAVDPDLFKLDVPADDIKEKYNLVNKIVIGFVGTFHTWHGVDFLIGVFKKFHDNIPNTHLLLVGDGKIRSNLETLIRENNLNNSVSITGYVAHDIVTQYISVMDIAVLPNSNTFGSPVKLFEYMAMSKAVVAPRYLPVEEVIKDQSNGILFSPLDSDQLLSALAQLVNSEDLRNEIGKRGRMTVLENHTWKMNAQKIIKKYELIGGSPKI